jgi:hypothetical protein
MAVLKGIEFNLSSLKDTKPHEYAVRFLFGGISTVLAGLIARRFGPGVGGLFLAFPAIFPAGVSLIETHEKTRKAKIGCDGTNRGRVAASLDAQGAALGCVGLSAFAFVSWRGLGNHDGVLTIFIAAVVWLVTAYALWVLRASRREGLRRLRVAPGRLPE